MYVSRKEKYDALVLKKEKVDKVITKIREVKQNLQTNLVFDNKIPAEELIGTTIEKLHYCSNSLNIVIKNYEDKINKK